MSSIQPVTEWTGTDWRKVNLYRDNISRLNLCLWRESAYRGHPRTATPWLPDEGATVNALEPLRLSAAYNRWVNEGLYAACAALDGADYLRDLGAFFRSVHGTLNHLLLVDRLWLERLRGLAPAFTGLDTELHGDFDALCAARGEADTAIVDYVDTLDAAALAQPLCFTSFVTRRTMRMLRWVGLTQLFNHQLHHRGQVTVLLGRQSVDYGDIDLIWMPGVVGHDVPLGSPPP